MSSQEDIRTTPYDAPANPDGTLSYDRTKTGHESRFRTWSVDYGDGMTGTRTGTPEPRIRPAGSRERCGDYVAPDGDPAWGDHRVTIPGTTCEEVQCQVAHHPDIAPGWSEPTEEFYDRPGVGAIAATLWGWDGGGMLGGKIGDTLAWNAAHVAMDALRDAGYEIVRKAD